jgi:hypothetical protein
VTEMNGHAPDREAIGRTTQARALAAMPPGH